jgi:hypothetical protein
MLILRSVAKQEQHLTLLMAANALINIYTRWEYYTARGMDFSVPYSFLGLSFIPPSYDNTP